jgi:hypothetical protein
MPQVSYVINCMTFLFDYVQTISIIEHCGYDSFEAATAWFVISCFMPKGLKCHTETIVISL